MGSTRTISFANFICRFGSEKVLLDLAEEVVIPAFLEPRERRYSSSRFFFRDVELVDFGTESEPELLIVGRVVHDTLLVREQVFKGGVLVKDHAELASAPSSLFALVLDTHKLLYLPETRYAPTISAFRATVAKFINEQHHEFIKTRLRSLKVSKQKVSRDDLIKAYPVPTVEIIPLSSESSLKDFLDQFLVLREVRIELVEPNDELDSQWLIKHMRNTKSSLRADVGELSFRGSSAGLSASSTLKEIAPIAEQANTKITLSGTDKNGDKLVGNNDAFKMGMPVTDIASHPVAAGYDLYGAFRDKVDAGLLKVQEVKQNARLQLKKLSIQATRRNDSGRK